MKISIKSVIRDFGGSKIKTATDHAGLNFQIRGGQIRAPRPAHLPRPDCWQYDALGPPDLPGATTTWPL